MSKILPFKVKPKSYPEVEVGNENCGVLSVKKMQCITEQEMQYVEDKCEELGISDFSVKAAKLAYKIGKKSGRDVKELFEAMQNTDIVGLAEDLPEFMDLLKGLNKDVRIDERVRAACILLHRCECEVEPSDLADIDFIHHELVKELASFYVKERDGWLTEEESKPVELTSKQIKK